MQFSKQVCKFHSVNTTDVNDDFNIHKLSVKFLINLNFAELPSTTFEFKIRVSVILL